jgi:hypothetical protein
MYPLIQSIHNRCMHSITVILLYGNILTNLKYLSITFKITLNIK